MFRVSRVDRAVLAGAAFASFAGSFAATPLTARGDADTVLGGATQPRPSPTATAFAAILPRRDPFGGDPPPRRTGGAPVAAIPLPVLPPFPTSSSTAADATIPAGLGPLPPNAGAPGTPLRISPAGAPAAPPSATVRVTAVITGTHPYALVDDGPTARLVTVGDRIGDDTVAAITAGGIRLARGPTIPLAPAAPAIRPPSGDHQQ